MELMSINVGRPREIDWNGRMVRTSIWKAPVEGRVRVATLNLEGDQQSDLSVHGGRDKAVYVYPSEHYAYWRKQLPSRELPWGIFGENLTTQDLLESEVRIGDRIRIGSAEFVVTQPRLPCFKLGLRFGDQDMVRRFLKSGRPGFYLAVLSEGEIATSDPVTVIFRDEQSLTVRDLFRLYNADDLSEELLRRVVELPALAQSWKDHFQRLLGQFPP